MKIQKISWKEYMIAPKQPSMLCKLFYEVPQEKIVTARILATIKIRIRISRI